MKKALDLVVRIITILILIFAICVMIFTVVSVSTLGKDADLFGYKPYIVLSDSMQDTFAVGDISVSKKVDPTTLEVGDIVTFTSIDPANSGEVVTHKIREITTYEGQPAFVTYGTTTDSNDSYPVPFDHVIGEYVFRLPKMGYFFNFLKSPAGYVTVILIPFLILIGLQMFRFFKLIGQYRSEQRAELDQQKAQLEEERQEAQRMKEELERLRAQVGDGKTEESLPPATEKKEEKGKKEEEDEFDAASIVSEFTGGDL